MDFIFFLIFILFSASLPRSVSLSRSSAFFSGDNDDGVENLINHFGWNIYNWWHNMQIVGAASMASDPIIIAGMRVLGIFSVVAVRRSDNWCMQMVTNCQLYICCRWSRWWFAVVSVFFSSIGGARHRRRRTVCPLIQKRCHHKQTCAHMRTSCFRFVSCLFSIAYVVVRVKINVLLQFDWQNVRV